MRTKVEFCSKLKGPGLKVSPFLVMSLCKDESNDLNLNNKKAVF